MIARPQTRMSMHSQEAQYLSRLDAKLEGRLDGFASYSVKDDIGQSSVVGNVAKQAQHGHMKLTGCIRAQLKLVCTIMAT